MKIKIQKIKQTKMMKQSQVLGQQMELLSILCVNLGTFPFVLHYPHNFTLKILIYYHFNVDINLTKKM